MYAVITRRTSNPARQAEARERGPKEYFPQLRQAPGFRDLYLVSGEDGVNTAVVVWESKAQADAFLPQQQGWMQALEEMGLRSESRTTGEVATHVTAQR
jgi:heme-degrading monooxygenase HmoA